ncbi:MAG: hypothetical protein WBN94_10330 [Methanothrix sp.]
MTTKQVRPDLEKMISLGRRGIIYPDHMERWEQFKKEWSEEDFVFWDQLMEKMKVDDAGTLKLSSPLSSSEKKWSKNFIHRAEEKGLC